MERSIITFSALKPFTFKIVFWRDILNCASRKCEGSYPIAESVYSALVSAVSKAKMSDLTESLAPK